MTEMNDIRKAVLWPKYKARPVKLWDPRPVRYSIDPTAFVVALIAAPLAITAMTFWAYFVPVAALLFGGPIYLILAVPVLLWDLPRHEPDFGRLAGLGFLASTGFALMVGALGLLLNDPDMGAFAGFYGFMGAIFAPLWAGMFAPLYKRFRRTDHARAFH